MGMIDLKQQELYDWQKRNFPRSKYDDLSREQLIDMLIGLQVALGMAEEVGEVCHHILKGTQKIRGGVGGTDKEEVANGIGDTLIYGLQLMSHLGLDANKEIEKVRDTILQRNWIENPEGKEMGLPVQG
jgi:NTP pyrophosphatase (non-canonical NTP hydrolase)